MTKQEEFDSWLADFGIAAASMFLSKTKAEREDAAKRMAESRDKIRKAYAQALEDATDHA